MVQIPVYAVLTTIVDTMLMFWNYLDNIILVPEFGDGVSLLELFIGIICLDVILFLVFGFLGWNDGDDD